jgi:hypothetical protein
MPATPSASWPRSLACASNWAGERPVLIARISALKDADAGDETPICRFGGMTR